MEQFIRWKRGDYIRLGRAISRFNKIINEIEVDEVDVLPSTMNYKELKNEIYSRKELNRIINALNRANAETLSKIKTFESGEAVTQWEYGEINKAMRRSLRNLEQEKASILSERPSIGMGDERLSEIRAIEASFDTLQQRTGRSFEKLKERIMKLGRTDYKLKKAEVFRENFYKSLEGISNFQNYDILKKELDKIQNPIKFYEYVKKSPVLMDIFLWYKSPEALQYGGFNSNQEAFDSSLMFHLGISDVDV